MNAQDIGDEAGRPSSGDAAFRRDPEIRDVTTCRRHSPSGAGSPISRMHQPEIEFGVAALEAA